MKWQTKVRQGAKQNFSGVKHFLEGVKENLRGVYPPNPPPENPPMNLIFLEVTAIMLTLKDTATGRPLT